MRLAPLLANVSRLGFASVGVALALTLLLPAIAAAAEPWLFVNDVHFNPGSRNRRPQLGGADTNEALLVSALAEMRRVAPNPPVVVMDGDSLDHYFKSPGIATMVALANRFNAAFPHAQFVFALGNEDSDCGDYAVTPDSPFLRAVAKAWEPLVNRNGAAPDFVRTFAHDGFYTARLPIGGIRVVVADDAFWSPFYHNACGHGDPTPQTFAELDRALTPAVNERRWLVLHIPPGTDAGSTVGRARHLAIVPFLRPDPRDRILQLAGDPARHVELVVTAHVHRFAYRIINAGSANPIPILVSPAISPIFYNNPSFLTADVAPDGRIRNLQEHSRVRGRWTDVGDLGTLGVSQFSGSALVNLQRRLEREPALRATYARMYTGGTRWREIKEQNWRAYWCVATEFTATAYRECLDEGGFSFLTRRGVVVVGAAIAALLLILAASGALIVTAIRKRRARSG